jgi:hypothetical protein
MAFTREASGLRASGFDITCLFEASSSGTLNVLSSSLPYSLEKDLYSRLLWLLSCERLDIDTIRVDSNLDIFFYRTEVKVVKITDPLQQEIIPLHYSLITAEEFPHDADDRVGLYVHMRREYSPVICLHYIGLLKLVAPLPRLKQCR